MAYCTEQDLIDRFGSAEVTEAADHDNDGTADTGVIDKAIADADADVNRYLRGRYAVPVVGSTELARIACDLARYYLWGIRAPEHITERYKAAIATLRDYARGVIVLDAVAATTTGGPSAPAVVAPSQVFTSDALDMIGLKP